MHVHVKFPDVPSEALAEALDAVYNGDLDDGDWALADLECTPGSTVAGRAGEIHEYFRRVQQARREDNVGVPQKLLELLCCLAINPTAAPSQAINPNVERL